MTEEKKTVSEQLDFLLSEMPSGFMPEPRETAFVMRPWLMQYCPSWQFACVLGFIADRGSVPMWVVKSAFGHQSHAAIVYGVANRLLVLTGNGDSSVCINEDGPIAAVLRDGLKLSQEQ